MAVRLQRRLPGFRFEVQAPELPEKLPRMDIAVFVGFASAGPIDVPVVLEDVARFAIIFGPDASLARDSRTGEVTQAYLGPAVRAFFANGGRRCWIIRVAENAREDHFAVPGVVQKTNGSFRQAFARARSAGSWFDRFECGTALSVDMIQVKLWPSLSELFAQLPSGLEVEAGDLLRLRTPGATMEAFFSVEGVDALTPSPLGANVYSVKGRTVLVEDDLRRDDAVVDCEATWDRCLDSSLTRKAKLIRSRAPQLPQLNIPVTSPETPAFLPPIGTILTLICGSELVWFKVEAQKTHIANLTGDIVLEGRAKMMQPSGAMMPGGTIICEKLTFELRGRDGLNEQRLSDLGFAFAHGRAWQALPDDRTLFSSNDIVDRAHTELARQAREHPNDAGRFVFAGAGEDLSLPLFMEALPTYLPAAFPERDPIVRDGLVKFDAALFSDPHLADERAATLMEMADFWRYEQTDFREEGVHVHPLRGMHAALAIEEATLLAIPDSIHFGWELAGKVSAPAATSPQPLAHQNWGLSDQCGIAAAAATGEEPNYAKFLKCALRVLEKPILRSEVGRATGSFRLFWSGAEQAVRFVLEESTRPDQSDAAVIYVGNAAEYLISGRQPGAFYYRVRSEAEGETSNWSNVERVEVAPESSYVTKETDGGDLLLKIHLTMLRMCAARGDLVAILSLPGSYRGEEVINYTRALKGIGNGESSIFSYGAVYHPWVYTRAKADEPPRISPPDGTIIGSIAAGALRLGAWMAPANQPLKEIIALRPSLSSTTRLDLLLAQINEITQEPNEFVVLNADTLSLDPELRPINVRRLLILLRRAALQRGAAYVFEPNGAALRRMVHYSFESLMSQLFARGAFAGDTPASSYEVVTDATINTARTMNNGLFRVDLKVAPSVPMSFVTIRLVQTAERGFTTEIL